MERSLWFSLVFLCAFAVNAATLESGAPIAVGAGDRSGPLASRESYRTCPVGAAEISGGSKPDIFVLAPFGVTKELSLHPFSRFNADGEPVFAAPVPVKGPWRKIESLAAGRIFTLENEIYYAWPEGKELAVAKFDRAKKEFFSFRKWTLPFGVTSLVFAGTENGDWVFFAARPAPPTKKFEREPADQSSLYDGAGIYRGNLGRGGVWRFRINPETGEVSAPDLFGAKRDDLLGGVALTVWPDADGKTGAMAATSLGSFRYVAPAGGKTLPVFGDDRQLLRHPTHGATAIAYGADGLIAGGEGSLYFYPAANRRQPDGSPVFAPPRRVLAESAALFTGALTVPSLFDWDGDGVLDIIAGNSEGRVLFCKNFGSNAEPAFAPGVALEAGGAPIHIQPGYYGIQGPFEARWGYTCPTVVDWNGDGLPDILMSDATAKYRLYLNTGSRTKPVLDRERLLKLDGLDLHGTWRVKPGAAKLGDRMACITYDDDNDFHLYWRLDDENVEDGGKLRWANGQTMTGWALGSLQPGQRGRGKISLVDWDGDGKLDILFGAMRRNCLPGPLVGLPWTRFNRGESGMQILFIRNVGSNEAPVFAFPKQFQFRGKDLFFGSHTSSGDAGMLGDCAAGPNLILGVESGRIHYFDRRDLTWAPSPWKETSSNNTAPAGGK
ncbi:MAG: FG-GAP repeat domain-containing protein [Victivallaceae bacterium]